MRRDDQSELKQERGQEGDRRSGGRKGSGEAEHETHGLTRCLIRRMAKTAVWEQLLCSLTYQLKT